MTLAVFMLVTLPGCSSPALSMPRMWSCCGQASSATFVTATCTVSITLSTFQTPLQPSLPLGEFGNNQEVKLKEHFAYLRYNYDFCLQNLHCLITSQVYPLRGVRPWVWPADPKGIYRIPYGTDCHRFIQCQSKSVVRQVKKFLSTNIFWTS